MTPRTSEWCTGNLDNGSASVPVVLELFASGSDELLAAVPGVPATVNPEARLIGGPVMPWNVNGSPSVGRARFLPGSIHAPADQSRVKLLVEHDPNRSVGHMTAHEALPTVLLAAYRVADGPEGDQALAAALDKRRDGLSVRVEVDDWTKDGDVIVVRSSRWRETSLVAIPAFDDARAAVLAASHTDEGNTIMAKLAELLDLTASTPAPTATAAPAVTEPPAAAPATPALLTTAPAVDQLANAILAGLADRLPQTAPATEPPAPAPVTPSGGRGPLTVQAAAEAVAEWRRSGSENIGELMAALSDVVPANDAGEGYLRPQWVGELWTARQARQPYIDALGTPSRLTGLKAVGWRWVTRPQVADYAGNKAPIPSNAVSTEPAEAPAHRMAGGWDVDRAYVDLGDPGFVTAMFQAATEDYAVKSDAWVGDQLAAAAANAAEGAPAAVNGATLESVLVPVAAGLFGIGAGLTFMAVATDVFTSLAGIKAADLPFWMANGGLSMNLSGQSGDAQGFRFFVDPTLAAGGFVAGDKRAATYYTQGQTPIRVQAVNIPNGGVDLGVFGYDALIVNDYRALYHGTITPV